MLAELTGVTGVVFTIALTVVFVLIAIRLILLAGRLVQAVENIAGMLEKSQQK